MAGNDLSTREKDRHRYIIGFGFLGMVAVLLLSPYSLLSHAQKIQENQLIEVFGAHADNWIASLAYRLSQATDLVKLAQSAHGFLGNRIDVIDLGLYIIAWRVLYMGLAILLSMPLLVVAVYDGVIRRRIAQWRYEYTSNRRHYMARLGVGYFYDVLLLLVVLPVPLPPLVVAVVMVILGMSLRTWIASLQKRM